MALSLVAAVAGLLLDLPEEAKLIVVTAGFTIPVTLLALLGPPALMRKPALIVDTDGVHFGARPPINRPGAAFVAWSAIREVYLYRVNHWVMVTSYIGLQGHDGVMPLKPYLPAGIAQTIWHVPFEVVQASRPATGWRLDPAAIKAAVGYFAPSVPVVDLTEVAAVQAQRRHDG
jgi:hypothetical protein